MTATVILADRLAAAKVACRPQRSGRVRSVVGMSVTVEGVQAAIGEAVSVARPGQDLVAEVVAIDDDGLVCMPLGDLTGIRAEPRCSSPPTGYPCPWATPSRPGCWTLSAVPSTAAPAWRAYPG